MSAQYESAVSDYFIEVGKQLRTGEAVEHAYRPALKQLMEAFGGNTSVNDPKRSEHGAPDFVFVSDANVNHKLGYAEAKDVGVDLDKSEKSDQLTRYSGYANLFLTDYLEFRFFRNGKKHATVVAAQVEGQQLKVDRDQFPHLIAELQAFLARPPQAITDGAHLANVMGGIARRLRYNVARYIAGEGDTSKNDELERIYELIRDLLVHDLDEQRFADMYAQTLVYGLFAARYNDPTPETFSRQEARELVPVSNPFLRQFFDHIAGPNFDSRLAYIVDELCEVFAVSAVREIVHQHLVQPSLTGDLTDAMDPIIHFYEDFLTAYDPGQRKTMGAYYTPVPVVRFMVRLTDQAIREEFNLPGGLADASKTTATVVRGDAEIEQVFHRVQILDPAVGTATFLNEIIGHIRRGFEGQEGRWPSYVVEDLVPRLHGFELMMAPYTVAHLKLGLTLRESGAEHFGQRLGVYLTNTLEEAANMPQTLFHFGLADAVAQEAIQAGEIKTERPIMVIIGNPPYSGESSNKTKFANDLVESYKYEPGGQEKLRERNPKWLNDDYVKFIAFAEAMIEKNGSGVVTMITNHGYLDNPTFRGMRWRLMTTFDSIRVLDLHGNAKKKEVVPGGGTDQNVFDIQQGVAIMLCIKSPRGKANELADVYVADIWGSRSEKFLELNRDEVEWSQVPASGPQYLFRARETEGEAEYLGGISVEDLFPVKSIGVVTGADAVLVGRSVEQLRRQLDVAIEEGTSRVARRLGATPIDMDRAVPISYRPFDRRSLYFEPAALERARERVTTQFTGKDSPNLGLIFRRQQLPGRQTYYFVTNAMIADGIIRSDNKGGESVAPLYLYAADGTRTTNISEDHLLKLCANLDARPSPEAVLDYCYGVLHSPAYRETYGEFLRTDFPRVPIAEDQASWDRLSTFGGRLRGLHLMTSAESNDLITQYSNTGDDTVERARMEGDRVYINESQYFGGVPPAAWNLFIGGYQPARKWLKDRRGSKLSNDDLLHYQRIISVLARTDELMAKIDI